MESPKYKVKPSAKLWVGFMFLAPPVGYLVFLMSKGYPIFDIYHLFGAVLSYKTGLIPSVVAASIYAWLIALSIRYRIKLTALVCMGIGGISGLIASVVSYPVSPDIDLFISRISPVKYFILFITTGMVTALVVRPVNTQQQS